MQQQHTEAEQFVGVLSICINYIKNSNMTTFLKVFPDAAWLCLFVAQAQVRYVKLCTKKGLRGCIGIPCDRIVVIMSPHC